MQAQSGATKVQVAANNAPGSEYRNVFIEGSDEAYRKVRFYSLTITAFFELVI